MNMVLLQLLALFCLLLPAMPAAADYSGWLKEWETFVPTVPVPVPARDKTGNGVPAHGAATLPLSPAKVTASGVTGTHNDSSALFLRQEQAAATTGRLTRAAATAEATAALLADSFSGDDLAVLAQLRSPAVAAARHALVAAGQSLAQTTYLDRILSSYSGFTASLINGVGPMREMETAKNSFPFPGITGLKGSIARLETEAASLRLEMAGRDAATAGRTIFGALFETLHQERVLTEMAALFQPLHQVATTRYENGSGEFPDVVAVRIRLEKTRERLESARQNKKVLTEKLRSLLVLPSLPLLGTPVTHGVPASLPVPDTLQKAAESSRQEIKLLDTQIARMETMLEMGETMVQPQLTLGFSRFAARNIIQSGSGAAVPAFTATTAAEMGAGRPIAPFSVGNDAYLKRLFQETEAARKRRQGLVLETTAAVQEKWFALDRAVRQTRLYDHTIVPLARAAADVARRGYENGKLPFQTAIDTMATLLDARLQRETWLSRIGIAHAQLEQTTGAPVGIPFSHSTKETP